MTSYRSSKMYLVKRHHALTKSQGKVHKYLGMNIDFSEEGKVKFTMEDYIKEMLEELPEEMNGTAPAPAASHLFDMDETAEILPNYLADLYLHNTAKLLFLCKRARPDLQTAVSFLCTRVKKPDVDNYKKLCQTMRYLRGSLHMPLTLEAEKCSDQ